jgi:hypothetical protein
MSLKSKILKRQFDVTYDTALPRDLGDGLTLRYATLADAEPLAQFNGWTFGRDRFDQQAAAWTRDLCSEAHPACGPGNITIVEESRTGNIVSTMCLIPQTWTYAGIPFQVGRMEAVATAPDHRRHGLVAVQFDVLHAKSAAMGHEVQAITGIPWFYRQFGYEYALDLGGGRMVLFASIAALKEGESEPYRLRPMLPSDLSFVEPLYDRDAARSLVTCPRPDSLWQHLLTGYSPVSFENRPFQIIETAEGRAVGYLAPSREMEHGAFLISELAVVDGQSLRAVMPSVLRALGKMGEAQAEEQNKSVKQIYFSLGREHPLYSAIPELFTHTRVPYGWYIRVVDVPAFLQRIAPALNARLAPSAMAGHSGELYINAYTDGWRLAFDKGEIAAVERWDPQENERKANCAFPPLVFLQLLFGYRSLGDLRGTFPDCWAADEAAVLLDILFPRLHSNVIPIG